jgi:hypothetical protein
VGVGHQRDVRIGMPKCLRDSHHIHAGRQQVARELVPQIVEPHLTQPEHVLLNYPALALRSRQLVHVP